MTFERSEALIAAQERVRNRFYSILNEIGTQAIVLLSTHIVQDVQEMCSQFAIIDRGTVLFSGKTEDALDKIVGHVYCMEREEDDIPNVLTTKYAFGKKYTAFMGQRNPNMHPSFRQRLKTCTLLHCVGIFDGGSFIRISHGSGSSTNDAC